MYGCVERVLQRHSDDRATRSLDSLFPLRAHSGSQRRRATRSLDSGARCSPVRARSGIQRGRRATRSLDSGAAPPSALAPGTSAGRATHSLGLGRTLLPRLHSLRERARAARSLVTSVFESFIAVLTEPLRSSIGFGGSLPMTFDRKPSILNGFGGSLPMTFGRKPSILSGFGE